MSKASDESIWRMRVMSAAMPDTICDTLHDRMRELGVDA